MKTGFETYKNVNTMGMSQLDLILMVYGGTINYLNQARTDFQESHFANGRDACDRARNCMVHLYTTLNMEKGEQIAKHLGYLYAHIIEQIDLCVASKSVEKLDNVIGILTTIKEGWSGLKDQQVKPSLAGAPQATLFSNNPIDNSQQSTVPEGNRLVISA